jgi:hypothetical protein
LQEFLDRRVGKITVAITCTLYTARRSSGGHAKCTSIKFRYRPPSWQERIEP